ncbi:MAG: hypothetical protein IJK18_09610 [Clostridia bacterium]|nr:hypothetical protein [Clostridia bacterium]
MIRKTISKILIIAIMVTMVIATIGQTTVSAAKKTENITLTLSKARVIKNGTRYEDKGAYALNTGSDHPLYQIVKLENGNKAGTNFLCLNATRGVTWNNNTVGTGVTYDTSYDLATDKSAIAGLTAAYNNVAGTHYTQIMWLLDNILLGTDYYTDDDVDELLSRAGIVYEDRGGSFNGGPVGNAYYFDENKIKAINSSSAFVDTSATLYQQLYGNSAGESGYYYANSTGAKTDVKLSKDLIEAIEQAAVWYFTNYGDTNYDAYTTDKTQASPKAFLKYADGSEWKLLAIQTTPGKEIDRYGELQDYNAPTGAMLQEQASILYNYLIDAANKAATDGYTTQTKGTINIQFAGSSTDSKIVEDGNNYKVGPLKVTTTGNTTINGITVTSGTSTISDVTLKKASNNETITKPTSGENFYVIVKKSDVTGTIKVKATAKTTYVEKKLRIKEVINDSQAEQAVVQVTPSPEENLEKEIDIPLEKQFDLALRKTIVKVTNSNGTTKSILNENGNSATRTINVATSSIPDTATYKHRKDPVVIENGDVVTYRITIYNEGEYNGYASKIVDQLPTGMTNTLGDTVTSNKGTTYNVDYDTTNNVITLTAVASGANTINKFDGTTLSSDYVDVTCRISQASASDGTTKHYLTNIAYISEGYNTESNQVVTEDRAGNESKTTESPTQTASQLNSTDANSYKGNEQNPSVYNDTNNNTPFEGQQDDDDFEKVVVLPKQLDLALRKFITKVNNQDITNREPVIGTWKYDNNRTLEKTHPKTKLVVKTGDTIVYTIRVYNEGEIDGYASEVTDYLPAGLTLKTGSTINNMFGWTQTGNKITTDYLSKAKEDTELAVPADYTPERYPYYTGSTTLLLAYNETIMKEGPHYRDLSVECVVNENATYNNLKNIAAITGETDSEGNPTTDRDSQPDEVNTDNYNPTNPENGRGEQDDDDFEDLKLAEFDLSLRKFISKVSTDGNFEDTNTTTTYNRTPQVDSSKLKAGTAKTATYNHSKEPVQLYVGDYVLYTIRAYNEGDIAGYASQIIDYLPNYLDFVESTDSYIKQINDKWDYDNATRKATTKADSANATTKLNAFDAQNDNGNGSGLSFVDVQIVCKVNNSAPANRKLTNLAEITEYKDENGNVIAPTTGDRDSKPSNFPEDLKSEETRPDYNGGTDTDTTDNYVPGQEDDDDFEKVIVRKKKIDLALTKFITAVSVDDKIEDGEYLTPNKNIGSRTNEYIRATVADTTGLKNGTSTNATYSARKDIEPLAVNKNSYILYNIRVYNEGEVDVFAGEVTDYLPENLEFVKGDFNTQYGWTANGQIVKTTYLSSANGQDKILKAFDKVNDDGKGSGMDYKDLPVLCKVSDKAESGKKMVNTAEITKYEDKDGKEIQEDEDSKPNNKEEKNVEERDQDDDDYEVVVIKDFDLALRKFITEIDTLKTQKDEKSTPVTNFGREPKLTYENGKITYTHPKDVLRTTVDAIVIYTLRVYNEGDIAGFAQEIADDLPEHLEYLPEHATNREYKWVMYDKDGKTTTKVSDAVRIKTDYTSKSNGELLMKNNNLKENPNLLNAFDKKVGITDTNPDYVDVKVAFKVKDPKSNKTVIVNKAQITDDADENGNPVEDVDSIPDKWNDGEDDQDYENVAVDYFDLSLLKYVTKTIVTENGKTKTTKTGNNGSDKDITPKVEVYRKSVNKTIVKFEYTIKITNEGDIAGYAKEITDYVPKGLKFYKEDNKGWKDEGNNVISTKLLKDTLLQPGQSATVKVILRWVNGENNLGVKTNVAEISQDYNEKGVPDRDSTPDNKKPKEDDIDDAPVLLTISTGMLENTIQYVTGALIILVVLGLGLVFIKKYVL